MTLCSKTLLLSALLVSIVHNSVAPPVTQKPEVENDILENIGVEYKRYLQEVVQALESDNEFRAKLEKAEDADLRSGKIAQELQYVRHDVRSKLDELKRAELERLRHYIRKQAELKQGLDPDHIKKVNDQTGHIDGSNPHSFEIADLEKLIAKTTQHLAEADRRRREEFKEYEMQKEFERNQERKTMNQLDRDKFDQKLNEQRQALRHRQPQLHHPGSKKQLEEVWQYQDHMNVRDFDPKTFFFMHDVDGNGFLDQEEVKALFLRELEKLYSMGYPGEDLRERTEEMERMREHVFVEADTNRDGVISLQEWLDLTRRPDFNNDPGWDVLEPKKEFTEEEYHQFEQQRQKEIEALIAQGKLARKTPAQIQREALYAKQTEEALAALDRHKQEYQRMKDISPIDPKYIHNQGLPVYQQEQKVPHEHYSHGQSPDHVQFQQQLHAAQQLHAQQQQVHHQQQQLHAQQQPISQQQVHPQQPVHHQQQQLHAQQQPISQQQLHPQQQSHEQPHHQVPQQPGLHTQQADILQQAAAQPAQKQPVQQQEAHKQPEHHQQAPVVQDAIPQQADNTIHH